MPDNSLTQLEKARAQKLLEEFSEEVLGKPLRLEDTYEATTGTFVFDKEEFLHSLGHILSERRSWRDLFHRKNEEVTSIYQTLVTRHLIEFLQPPVQNTPLSPDRKFGRFISEIPDEGINVFHVNYQVGQRDMDVKITVEVRL